MSQLALCLLIQVNPEDYDSKKNKQLKDYTTPNNSFGHREGNTECNTYIIALGLKGRRGQMGFYTGFRVVFWIFCY